MVFSSGPSGRASILTFPLCMLIAIASAKRRKEKQPSISYSSPESQPSQYSPEIHQLVKQISHKCRQFSPNLSRCVGINSQYSSVAPVATREVTGKTRWWKQRCKASLALGCVKKRGGLVIVTPLSLFWPIIYIHRYGCHWSISSFG